MNDMSDKFICNECQSEFTLLDGGFIGSIDDFEFRKLSNDDKILNELNNIECSPFLSYVELCKDCYLQKDKG